MSGENSKCPAKDWRFAGQNVPWGSNQFHIFCQKRNIFFQNALIDQWMRFKMKAFWNLCKTATNFTCPDALSRWVLIVQISCISRVPRIFGISSILKLSEIVGFNISGLLGTSHQNCPKYQKRSFPIFPAKSQICRKYWKSSFPACLAFCSDLLEMLKMLKFYNAVFCLKCRKCWNSTILVICKKCQDPGSVEILPQGCWPYIDIEISQFQES